MGTAQAVLAACVVLLGISAIEHYARKSSLPPVCWMLFAGTVLGWVGRWAGLEFSQPVLNPDVLLYVFLPLLIFDSSRRLHIRELRAVAWNAGLLATLGVVVSAVLLAWGFSLGMPVKWIHLLLLGVVLSATDPIAVAAVFARFPIPGRLRTLIEAESLLNDGTVMILYSVLVGSALGTAHTGWERLSAELLLDTLGALGVGALIGALFAGLSRVWHTLHDRFIGALMPLICVYLTFLAAQYVLNVSGVIAVMTATLTLNSLRSRQGAKWPEASQLRSDVFLVELWHFFGQLVNSVLFLLLGLEIGSHEFHLSPAAMAVVLVGLPVSRFVVVNLITCMTRTLCASWHEKHILVLAGARGALSAALVLMLPVTYAYRDTMLCTVFAAVMFTLIPSPLVLKQVLRKHS